MSSASFGSTLRSRKRASGFEGLPGYVPAGEGHYVENVIDDGCLRSAVLEDIEGRALRSVERDDLAVNHGSGSQSGPSSNSFGT